MYITLESDYAVRITAQLCKSARKEDARTLAEECGVSLRFALKILGKLVAADIVKSTKGAAGGYMINKNPAEITLSDIIEVTEGKYYFSRCLEDGTKCSRGASGSCNFQKAFADITETVRAKLEEYTFADLIEEDKNSMNNQKEI